MMTIIRLRCLNHCRAFMTYEAAEFRSMLMKSSDNYFVK